MAYVAYAMMWIAIAAAATFAVYWTNSATPLWALIIPLFIELKVK